MAHFAELDEDNKVLRVVVGCNQDIANNGGELSIEAANHFATVCPLSINGVKWVQTSYNNNFRKKYAATGDTYDLIKDKFIAPQPYPSWSLDNNDDWQAPVPYPVTYTLNLTTLNGGLKEDPYGWNEANQSWDLQSIS